MKILTFKYTSPNMTQLQRTAYFYALVVAYVNKTDENNNAYKVV